MKKTLLLAILVSGIGMVSCEKGDSDKKNSGELVDVTISSDTKNSRVATRAMVTGSGVTRWAVGDEVMIVDADKTLRAFKYLETNPQSNGKFQGQLLGSQGLSFYYAFYAPEYIKCIMDNNYCLSITRENLVLNENDEHISASFGKCCPMVAIPVKFDVAEINNQTIEFHHLNCLIEASISGEGNDELKAVNFDKVVFELAANGNAPLNTQIQVKMTEVKGKPDNDVAIPFSEVGDKVSTMSTTINYNSLKNLGELMAASEVGCYSIPLFSLPTKDDFSCMVRVTFYLNDNVVYRLQNDCSFRGLNPAGLNVLNFNATHKAEII